MKTKEYIFNGVFYLLYNGLNLLFPFVFSLLISRNLAESFFSKWILFQTVGLYMYLLADYSFSYSGAKKMVQLESKIERVKYYNLITRFKLSIVTIVGLIFFIYFKFVLQESLLVFCVLLIGAFSNLINPSWFFHAQGNTKIIMMVNMLYKIPVLILLFYMRIDGLMGYLGLFVGVNFFVALHLIKIEHLSLRQVFVPLEYKKVLDLLIENLNYFIFSISTTFYTSFNYIIIEHNIGDAAVARYGYSEKLTNILYVLPQTIINFMFPFMKKGKFAHSKIGTHFMFVLVLLFITGSFAFIIFLFGDQILNIVYNVGLDNESASIFKFFSIVNLIRIFSGVYGICGLMAFGHEKSFNLIILFAAVLNLIFIQPLINLFGLMGVVYLWLCIEAIISVLSVIKFYIYEKNISVNRNL